MNRLTSILLILLVGASGFGLFGFYQYTENRRITQENQQLKSQLDTTADQLRKAEDEAANLRSQLNQTQTQVTELEGKTTQLEQQVQNLTSQIEKLRQQLKLRDYTTIGLTFLWNKMIQVETADLSFAVQDMNRVWDPLHIYFFIYHAGEADFLPIYQGCSNTPSWATRAWTMYPGNDIPIAIFSGFTLFGSNYIIGCAWSHAHVIAVVESYAYSSTLTHEVLHAMVGITDAEIDANPGSDRAIPLEWMARIQVAARRFQMPLPSS